MAGGDGTALTRRQERFLTALLSYPTIVQAAKAAGISEATAGRWMKEEAFAAAYRDARRKALDQILAFVEQTMTASVAVLRSVMLAQDTPPAVKVTAAKVILETGLRCFEIGDQEARLQALEAERGIGR